MFACVPSGFVGEPGERTMQQREPSERARHGVRVLERADDAAPVADTSPSSWLTGAHAGSGTAAHPPAEVLPDVEERVEPGEPKQAHIVKVEPGESAAAKVLEARIYGTPIEALCGHVWVPSRDPKQLPLCQECKSIYEMYKSFNGDLPEQPNE